MIDTLMLSFTALGIFVVLATLVYTALQVAQGIRAHLLLNTLPFTTKYGKWAVVTGSTDGIGRAYALELAKRGLNICLVSRSQEKLDRVSEEIKNTFLVETKTIKVDFSEGKHVYEKIETELKSIPVGILVNNVGSQYEYPMYVAEVPEKQLWDIINVNIGATTQMTRMILPQMLDRGKGAIVNVSSGSEAQPLPLMTVYAASKVFIKSFSAALRLEYSSKGITIQHLAPLFVTTKMNAFSNRLLKPTLFVPDATAYAAGAVNTLGLVDESAGYWSHGVQTFFVSFLPVYFRSRFGYMMNSVFRNDYIKNKKGVD